MRLFTLGILVLVPVSLAFGQPSLEVRALMPDRVVIQWQGERHQLGVGDGVRGLRLKDADSDRAVFEYEGERFEKRMGTSVGGAYAESPSRREVRLEPDASGLFRAEGRVNGHATEFIVDTGANVVAMGRDQAEAFGLDPADGTRSRVETAAGTTTGYRLRIDEVVLRGITVTDVNAVIIDGGGPPVPLLGMSFLGQVNMRHESGTLILQSAR